MKLWQKEVLADKKIETYTVGDDAVLDLELVEYDCRGSAAHAEMLGKIGIITGDEVKLLVKELDRIAGLARKGEFDIRVETEDCHTAIENHLTAVLGEVGKKIHTYRSRNDQVQTALRLFYKDRLQGVKNLVNAFIRGLVRFRESYGDIPLPGYTHTRKAMPSSVQLWAGAFIEAMNDNRLVVEGAMELVDQSPLGSGAGYGIPHPIDRHFTARQMGFQRVQANPLYVQNSRGKFEAHILNVLSLSMLDLNKLASDLIVFSMPEWGFFKLPGDFLTGSSIMPHKQNPDFLEVLRANYHRIVSLEARVKGMVGNLISGYHRDVQLTKGPVFEGFRVTEQSLEIVTKLFERLEVDQERCEAAMTDELFSAQKAFLLAQQGIPFRDAYQMTAKEF